MATWKLEDAKNSFSKVVRMAESEGPQFVTRNGRTVAVVVSAKEHGERELTGAEFVRMMRESPIAKAIRDAGLDELPLPPRDFPRDIDLGGE